MWVDVICLANSYKRGGRCVAGLRTDGFGWIRPMAPDTEFGQLLWNHRRLDDGSEPRLLDRVRIEVARPAPVPFQPENWELAAGPWRLVERPAANVEAALWHAAHLRPGYPLNSSSNAVSATATRAEAVSLALTESASPIACSLKLQPPKQPQVRIRFEMHGRRLTLPLTDPEWYSRAVRRLRQLDPGEHGPQALGIPQGKRVFLTISLSEPYNGACFKLVCGIVAL